MRLKLEGKAYIEQYAHTLTHELKSPLAAIRGAAELLQELPPPETARRFHQYRAAKRTHPATGGQTAGAGAAGESARYGDRAHRDRGADQPDDGGQRGTGDAARRQVTVEALAEVTLNGDALLISQALTNLLDNAIDFTPPGGCVSVRGERREQHYCISVCDDGSGIPDYALDKVFERFIRCRAPNGRKQRAGAELRAGGRPSASWRHSLAQPSAARGGSDVDVIAVTSPSLHITTF